MCVLIFVNNKAKQARGTLCFICMCPGKGISRGIELVHSCEDRRKADLGLEEETEADTRSRPEAEKLDRHPYFLVYTFSPGDFNHFQGLRYKLS